MLEPQPNPTFIDLRAARAAYNSGQLAQAQAACQRVLAREPANAYALHLLGLIAGRAGDLVASADLLERAARADPNDASHAANLGRAYGRLGRWDAAAASLHRAIEAGDASAETASDLGVALQLTGLLSDGVDRYRQALRVNPRAEGSLRNLASALLDLGRVDEAVDVYRTLVSLRPTDAAAHSDLLLTMHYVDRFDPAEILAEARRWSARHAEALYPRAAAFPNAREPDRRLRIGYISGDFRLHPVGLMMQAVLAAHDRTQVEVFCYAKVRQPDELTPRFAPLCDRWRDVAAMSDPQAAAAIRADAIDVLIDLSGHTGDGRLTVLARRPAPVQATWFGYPGTTGVATIDWRLTDAIADPPHAGPAQMTERPLRLPEVAWCYPPPAQAPAVAPLPAATQRYVTFACLNRLAKVTPRMLETWAQILAATPGSRLLLLAGAASNDALAAARLRAPFLTRGVEGNRIELIGRQRQEEYFNLYQRIDIALDCYPYNGGVTTCDALWMGVPVVTRAGDAYVSRQGASILSHLGLSDWMTIGEDQYVARAIAAARDLDALAKMRSLLRERMRGSTLCDVARFTRQLETKYRAAWSEWCRS